MPWWEHASFDGMMMDVRFVLDQHALSGFYSANSRKQQSLGGYICRSTRHIILIPSQPVFALAPEWWVLSREAGNTNVIVFGLTWPWLEPTIYRIRGEHANHSRRGTLTITPLMQTIL